MILSERILKLTSMVTPCGVVADIGCDHCLTLIKLLEDGVCNRGIGCDIRKGPLEKAADNLKKYDAADKIELRLGGGFTPLSVGEADTAVISGMGGQLIIDILGEHPKITDSFGEMILQPQLDVPEVRRHLHKIGFKIADEEMVFEQGIYYTIIRAVKGSETYEHQRDYDFGKILIENRNSILKKYLAHRLNKNNEVVTRLKQNPTENSSARLIELTEENKRIEEVQQWL